MKKIVTAVLVITLLGAAYWYFSSTSEAKESLYTSPTQGVFVQSIYASGELDALRSLKVRGPAGMRSADIWQTSIKDLIPEGTMVKKGDYIGSLDKTELATKISENQSEIDREKTKLEQMKIDTAIQMKDLADQISDVVFEMTQEKLEMEKNIYEPEMIIEQSKVKLEKSERSLEQLKEKLDLIQIQSTAKVMEILTNIKQFNDKLKLLIDLNNEFNIIAPEEGMLIYAKTWNGKKGVGSQISSWDPVVAELPDLTKMISKAYINEVDISKVTKGQLVKIKVDAFPEKEFTGKITSVANIGQELKNQEAKVFEVTIEVNEQDEVLKPSMTTTNEILIYEYEDVVSIPLESFYSDSLDFVIVKSNGKFVRKEVVKGPYNEDFIIIAAGLSTEDKLVLDDIEIESLPYESLDLEVKRKGTALINEWNKSKKAQDKINLDAVKDNEIAANTEAGGGIIVFQ